MKAGVISTRGETEVKDCPASAAIAKMSTSSSSSSVEAGFGAFFFLGGAANLCSLAESSMCSSSDKTLSDRVSRPVAPFSWSIPR